MRVFCFFTLLLISSAAFGQLNKPLRPLVFSIERQGEVGVIFGTHHLLTTEDLPSFVTSALNKAPVFVSEWNYSKTPIPKSLNDYKVPPLKPETIERLKERGLPAEKVPSWSPSKACSAYIFFEAYKRIQAAGGILDQKLEERAVSQHKELVQLDRIDLAMDVVKSVEKSCDINQLVARVNPTLARLIQDKTLSDFKEGDLNKIANADKSNVVALAPRNREWIEILEPNLRKGAFIVVGAAHLGGEEGLLNLLRRRGYRVERIHSQLELDLLQLDRNR